MSMRIPSRLTVDEMTDILDTYIRDIEMHSNPAHCQETYSKANELLKGIRENADRRDQKIDVILCEF